MSDTSTPSASPSSALPILTYGWQAAESAIISGVSAWFGSEMLKLGMEEIQQIAASLSHFWNNIRDGKSWGEAMASLLTEVWNGVKSELAQLATDFVEAVGKVLQNAGLLPATA